MMNKIKKVLEPMFGYGVFILMVLAIIAIFAILGGPILHLLGFKYQSVGDLILFFIIVTIVGFPIETLTKALPKALLYLKRIGVKSAKILSVILDTLATTIMMTIIDYFMDTVSATDITYVIFAFILAIVPIKDDGELSLK